MGRILYCHCASGGPIPAEATETVLRLLSESGIEFEAVPDLCRRAASASSSGADPIFGAYRERATVIACYPRAVRWLFARAGAAPGEGFTVINMRDEDPAAIVRAAAGESGPRPDGGAARPAPELGPASAWIPWYPVIDYDRCTDCGQCLNFCLFGVYARSAEGRIEVRNPEGCKTNCPACARICPELAIIFPRYEAGPLSGAEPSSGAVEPVKVDLAALLGGDPYAALRDRSRRFATGPEAAERERRRCACMAALRDQLDVPADVLAALTGGAKQAAKESDGDEVRG